MVFLEYCCYTILRKTAVKTTGGSLGYQAIGMLTSRFVPSGRQELTRLGADSIA